MKFNEPATANPIDQLKVVGQPISRIDGALEVTGKAPYAMNATTSWPIRRTATSSAQGLPKAASVDRPGRAQRSAGRHRDRDRANAGPLGKPKLNTAKLLAGPEVDHYHQAIALVVAQTFEQARAAAQLVRVDYAARRDASTSSAPRTQRPSLTRSTTILPTLQSATLTEAFAASPV